MKKKISARLDLSPVTEKVWEEAENKSQLINEALEFYAQHGRWIQKDLQTIRQLLEELKANGVSVNEAKQELPAVVRTDDVEQDKPISKEEQELQEGISSTLSHFIGGDDD